MATAAAKMKDLASPASANLAEPEVLEIEPKNVQVNEAGHIWKSVLARAPKTMVADDVRDPKIWKRVQAAAHVSLVKLDRVLVLGFDESWAVEGIVRQADGKSASLSILKVFSFGGINDGLFSDGVLEVHWDGASYGVRRVADKSPVATGYASEGLAVDALRKQYPRKVG